MSLNSANQLEGILQRSNTESNKMKIIRISSKEINLGEPYSFFIELGNNSSLDGCFLIQPICAIVPNIANNMSTQLNNNTMYINCSGGLVYIQIPDGYYTLNQVATLIVTQINAVKGVSYVSYNIVNNYLVFTVTGADFLALPILSNMGSTLGFTRVHTSTMALTANALCNLTGMTVCYVHSTIISNNLTYLNTNTGNINDVNGAFTIPINTAWGSNQIHHFDESQKIVLNTSQGVPCKQLNITLRKNGGVLYTELTPNQEFILVLKLFYK